MLSVFRLCISRSFIALRIFFDCVSKRPTGGGGGVDMKKNAEEPLDFRIYIHMLGKWVMKSETGIYLIALGKFSVNAKSWP